MILLGNFLIGVGTILNSLLFIYMLLCIARAVLSWVSPDPSNIIVRFIYDSTEPVLLAARRKIPPIGFLDFSVLIVILLLYFLQIFVANSMIQYGNKFVASGLIGG